MFPAFHFRNFHKALSCVGCLAQSFPKRAFLRTPPSMQAALAHAELATQGV